MTTENQLLPCPLTWAIQRINSTPYSLTKDECVNVLRGLRDEIRALTPPASHVPEADFGNNQPASQEQAQQPIKDHQIAQIVNQLRDIAIEFHGAQQLRERIAHVIVPVLKAQQPSGGEVVAEPGTVYVDVSGFTGTGKSAVAGEIEIAMRAIGLQVEWVDGQAEKSMTGADWAHALEMYKPRVVIRERNIPLTLATPKPEPMPETVRVWANSPELVEDGNQWQQGYEHARAWVHAQLSITKEQA